MAQAQQAGEPNRRQPKKVKKNRFSHTANTKYGMGDHYGTGLKQKLGKVLEDTVGVNFSSKKRLKVPPKSVV